MNTDHELLLEKMTLEEKVSLMTGRGIWDANPCLLYTSPSPRDQ